MKKVDFLSEQIPMCTKFPFYYAIIKIHGHTKYLELVKRSVADFGESLLVKRCPKHLLCTKECLGRPIPKYPELDDIVATQTNLGEGTYKGFKVWTLTATLCTSCPFKSDCTSTCGSVEDFMHKHDSDFEPLDDKLLYLETFEDFWSPDIDLPIVEDLSNMTINWDCLTNVQYEVMNLRVKEGFSYDEIAEKLSMSKKNTWKHFRAGLKRLKKFHKNIKR